MPNTSAIFGNRFALALTLVLAGQGALYYTAAAREAAPLNRPLADFPTQLGSWTMLRDAPLEDEVQAVLRADDTLNRVYGDASGRAVSLFIAYFRTQRFGQSPHSPKNCLPGSGWQPEETGFQDVAIPGAGRVINVNRYVVSHGDEKSVVLYWYQTRDRVVAAELWAKYWLVLDSIRYHRSDTSLVRLVMPVPRDGQARAVDTGVRFIQILYPALRVYLPA